MRRDKRIPNSWALMLVAQGPSMTSTPMSHCGTATTPTQALTPLSFRKRHSWWPKKILNDLGQFRLRRQFDVVCCVVRCGGVVCCGVCRWGVCSRFSWVRPRFGRSAGPPSAGPPSAGPPKFSLFSFPRQPQFRPFSLSGCFLVEVWLCFKRRDPQMCPFGLSGCGVKARRFWGQSCVVGGSFCDHSIGIWDIAMHQRCPNSQCGVRWCGFAPERVRLSRGT